ncbi:MAG: PPC domain-containing DNA-binding protein [Brevundimonas sp.]
MHSKRLNDHAGQRTFLLVLETGDEVMDSLQDFAATEGLTAAQITAIGAFQRAELAFFDWETKSYQPIPVDEQAEVATLAGDVALGEGGKPALHLHAVLGKRGGQAVAGHVTRGWVRPTLEVVLTETPAHLRRVKDGVTGLALIDPGARL